ncbi:MAG: hypothetical protein D6820_17005, partial [Lentisphaerae bacterium]
MSYSDALQSGGDTAACRIVWFPRISPSGCPDCGYGDGMNLVSFVWGDEKSLRIDKNQRLQHGHLVCLIFYKQV